MHFALLFLGYMGVLIERSGEINFEFFFVYINNVRFLSRGHAYSQLPAHVSL